MKKIFLLLLLVSLSVVVAAETAQPRQLSSLQNLLDSRENLQQQIIDLTSELEQAVSDPQKRRINQEIEQISSEIVALESDFEQIATDLKNVIPPKSNTGPYRFREDFSLLVEPIMQEMKHATASIREKNQLRQDVETYEQQAINAAAALENLRALQRSTEDKGLGEALNKLEKDWKSRLQQAQNRYNFASSQLETLLQEESARSFLQTSRHVLREFFQKRGFYLLLGVLSVVGVLLLSRFIYRYVVLNIPGMRLSTRTFRIRLIELIYRGFTILLAILAPMIVFYAFGDWLLFSIGVLFLLGMAWGLKYTVPRMWQQALMLLNIGPVREGERVFIDNLPWRVKSLNVYSELDNPVSGLRLRLPIESLMGEVSRPIAKGEPWFPCKKGDWVILSDGVRGKITGISQEMVELVERGGAKVSYQMSNFLAGNPRNLSTSFRLKEIIGISYDLQAKSTAEVLDELESYLQERIREEDYHESLLNLRVEFEQAGASSLDILVIADFKGELADIYNRLRRCIRRWTVDACTHFGWEIPFDQLTVHYPDGTLSSPQ